MIVGREVEMAEVERLLSRARDQTSALLIEGEPGIGKTTVFRAAMERGKEAGFAVLSCRAAASEAAFALAAVADIVEDIPRSHWAALPAPQLRALEAALHLADPGDQPIEPSALAAGVRSLIANIAAERPVLVGSGEAVRAADTMAAAPIRIRPASDACLP